MPQPSPPTPVSPHALNQPWAWLALHTSPTHSTPVLEARLAELTQLAEHSHTLPPEAVAEKLLLLWYQGATALANPTFEAQLSKAPQWHWATRYVVAKVAMRNGQWQQAIAKLTTLWAEPSPLQVASGLALAQCYLMQAVAQPATPYLLRSVNLLKALLVGVQALGLAATTRTLTPEQKHQHVAHAKAAVWGWLVIRPRLNAEVTRANALAWLSQQRHQFAGSALLNTLWVEALLLNRQVAQAQFWANEALQRHPNHINTWQHMAQVALLTQQPAQAEQWLKALMTESPTDTTAYELLAALYWQQGHKPQAIEALLVVLSLEADPVRKARFALTLAEWYHTLKQSMAALGYVQLALTLQPTNPEARQWLMALLREQNAYLALEAHCQLASGQQANEAGTWATSLGYVAGETGHDQRAKRLYLDALRQNPNDTVAANNLACLYMEVFHQPAEAEALLRTLLQADNTVTLAHFNLGRALSLQGKALEAAMAYERARHLNHVSHDLDDNELASRLSELF